MNDTSKVLRELPGQVLAAALASRFADLQDTNIAQDSQTITSPQPTANAGRRMRAASALLRVLQARLEEGETKLTPISLIHRERLEEDEDITQEELRFAARFLGTDRPFHYEEAADGRIVSRSTAVATRLVRYDGSTADRVALTESGRSWLRITQQRDNWLFEDKEIEKLASAIANGLFDTIPQIARSNHTSLRLMAESLARALQHPKSREQNELWLSKREHYGPMMQRCETATLRALSLLSSDGIQAQFDAWSERQTVDGKITLSGLQHAVQGVHAAAERVRRLWDQLIERAPQLATSSVGSIDFTAAWRQYRKDPPSEDLDLSFLSAAFGWGDAEQVMSFLDLEGSLPVIPAHPRARRLEFHVEPDGGDEPLQSWLMRNRERVLEVLSDGEPREFFAFVDEVANGSDRPPLSGAWTTFLIPDPVGERARIRIEGTNRYEDHLSDAESIKVTAAKIRLLKGPEDHDDP